MKLYVIVYEVLDGEPEWLFKARESMTQEEAEELAMIHQMDLRGLEGEDRLNTTIDNTLGSVWYNLIDAVDGHEITVEDKPIEYKIPFMEGLQESLDSLTIRKEQQ